MCPGLELDIATVLHLTVDDEPSLSDHISEGVIHESLEHGRGVTEAKEHDSRFKESFVGDEGHFPLMTILDADIITVYLHQTSNLVKW